MTRQLYAVTVKHESNVRVDLVVLAASVDEAKGLVAGAAAVPVHRRRWSDRDGREGQTRGWGGAPAVVSSSRTALGIFPPANQRRITRGSRVSTSRANSALVFPLSRIAARKRSASVTGRDRVADGFIDSCPLVCTIAPSSHKHLAW
jgi:hypothetical protein